MPKDNFSKDFVKRELEYLREIEAQVLEPNGGNLYRPHKLQVTSGQFWRCKHGNTGIGDCWDWLGCAECAAEDPIAAARFGATQPPLAD